MIRMIYRIKEVSRIQNSVCKVYKVYKSYNGCKDKIRNCFAYKNRSLNNDRMVWDCFAYKNRSLAMTERIGISLRSTMTGGYRIAMSL
jgi:hypothetical protein